MVEFYEGLFEELKLFVRQSAWLNAIPERPQNDRSQKPAVSRLERLRSMSGDPDYHPDMPDPGAASHVLAILLEIGPASSSGMGVVPISHLELAAWQSNIGVELNAWEARTLIRLSREYVSESRSAEKPDAPAPWSSDPSPKDRKIIALSMRESIRALRSI